MYKALLSVDIPIHSSHSILNIIDMESEKQ